MMRLVFILKLTDYEIDIFWVVHSFANNTADKKILFDQTSQCAKMNISTVGTIALKLHVR